MNVNSYRAWQHFLLIFFYQINDRILWLIMSEKSFFYRGFQNSIVEDRFRAEFLRIWESMTRQEKKSKTQHENKSSNNNFKIKKLIELKRFWICRSKRRVLLTDSCSDRKVNCSCTEVESNVFFLFFKMLKQGLNISISQKWKS